MQSELDEINKEIESGSRALSQCPDDDPQLPPLLAYLGQAHQTRYNLLGEPDDIQKTIEYTTMVLTLIPDEHPNRLPLLSSLGIAHGQRFEHLDDVDDLEKDLEYTSRALDMMPKSHPDLPRQLANLAVSHRLRFKRLGDLGDIEKAIDYDSRAVDMTPNDDPSLPGWLVELGTSHLHRFRHVGELNELEKAMKYYSQGLGLAPDSHPHRPLMLTNLSRSHSERFQRLGELDDLEMAMKYESQALNLIPDGHPNLPKLLSNLAETHTSRFQYLGELDDLETAIEYLNRACTLTPKAHPNMPIWLSDLGISHNHRFRHLGELNDVEKAIEYQARAINLTPAGHPDLPARLASLGISYNHRYEQLVEPDDLEKAIEYLSRAVKLTPEGHPSFSNQLGDLGSAYNYRFLLLGDQGDFERAIECHSRALKDTTEDDPVLCMKHFNLALAYVKYYEHTNSPSHLQDSLHSFRIACNSPVGAPRHRFKHARRWATHASNHSALNCIEAYQTTINLLPQFIWLGATTAQRYEDLKMTETLAVDAATAAILSSNYSLALEWLEHARCVVWNQSLMLRSPLDQLKASHPSLAIRLQTVASQLHGASSESRESRAASLGSLTPEQVGQEHRRLAKEYNQLLTQARALPGFEDFFQPIKANRLFPAARNGPIVVINCDNSRCDALLILPQQGNVNHILLPNFSGDKARRARSEIEFSVESQRLREREVERRPLVEEGQNYEFSSVLAVLWIDVVKPILDFLGFTVCLANLFQINAINPDNTLESCSSLRPATHHLVSQSIMLRAPLDPLEASHPSLATCLQTVANQLYSASSESRKSRAVTSNLMTLEQVGQEHRRLAKEYNKLLTQARALPGFEDLLKPIKANRLFHAARNGPIVVINCGKDRCDALLVLPEQGNVTHIPLPNFSEDKARRARSEMEFSIGSRRVREREVERRPLVEEDQEHEFESVLAVLWNDVVKPILDFLGFTNNAPVENLPHITWCPTGVITFLPLHAAGDYDKPRSRVFDYVISSYTPTLTALLESTPYSLTCDSRVLAIGQTATPGHSRLPGTAMELKIVKAHIQDKAEYSQLIDNQATTSAVLDAMEEHDWVHLACHAHQNVGDATKSGFSLHDGVLDLASINRRSLKNKGLAFLSACQTATGDEKLPDEAVHLASGMLMAGYRSVIATMWSVVDSDAPLVADKVYSELIAHGRLGNGEAGKALHNAVAGLREMVGEKEFGRWVPYIHIGS
ncbi:hypothetical protein RSAG8_08189, partial [Rhizoctonia solani AG-8 WAC10335]